MMDPLPPISKVFSYVVQQERQFVNSNMLGSMINATSISSGSNFYTYRGKDNHTIENRFQKNGYPPNFSTHRGGRGGRGSYGRENSRGRSNKNFTHCGTTSQTVDPSHRLCKPQGVAINNTIAELKTMVIRHKKNKTMELK